MIFCITIKTEGGKNALQVNTDADGVRTACERVAPQLRNGWQVVIGAPLKDAAEEEVAATRGPELVSLLEKI